MDSMLGFAAGVMIAASFWSLLAPGIQMADEMGYNSWLIAAIGFLSGGILMRMIDLVLPHLHPQKKMNQAEGIKTSWQRSTLLVSAITLHNIPEGLAVGVAFGAAAADTSVATIGGAIALTIGEYRPRNHGYNDWFYHYDDSRRSSWLMGHWMGM